ncbi:MAG: polyphosphate polymerase domain-containing protein [Clostridia bacterium]|nr:polyphosphate polymerase domain-containing protein [Clostridia bacterium]
MGEYAAVFERYEKKYLLDETQYKKIRNAFAAYFIEDKYGRHTIGSVYYDTDDFVLIRASLEKPKYKEKLRLRSYGTPTDDGTVFMEIKKKCGGVVYKRRVPLTLRKAREYDETKIIPDANSQIWREIEWFETRYHPAPRVLIGVERIAMYGAEDENLRVTFDFDMRFRTTMLDLSNGTHGTPLAPGKILMEVKIPGVMPFWMARIFSELSLTPVSFSKYGTAYRDFIVNGNGGKLSV